MKKFLFYFILLVILLGFALIFYVNIVEASPDCTPTPTTEITTEVVEPTATTEPTIEIKGKTDTPPPATWTPEPTGGLPTPTDPIPGTNVVGKEFGKEAALPVSGFGPKNGNDGELLITFIAGVGVICLVLLIGYAIGVIKRNGKK